MKKSGSEPGKSEAVKIPMIVWETVGWYGALAILFAYFAVSFALISPEGAIFQILNISGATGLLLIGWKKKVYQTVALNFIWILIGIIAVIEFVL